MTVTHARPVTVPAVHAGRMARARAWLRAAVRWLTRWSRTSAAIAAGAPIGHAERVLTTDYDLAGALVVTSRVALCHQDIGRPDRAWSRLRWVDVSGVFWDGQHRVLSLTGVRPGGTWRKELVLPSRTALVEVARERVTATLLASTMVRLDDQACAWVMARRDPGSGKVIWMVVLNGSGATANPAIGARVEEAIAGLQAQTGIPASIGSELRHRPRDHLPLAYSGRPVLAAPGRGQPRRHQSGRRP